MFTIPDLIRLLAIENQLIHNQTGGLSQADTLIRPPSERQLHEQGVGASAG
jgi:hypothetical protein